MPLLTAGQTEIWLTRDLDRRTLAIRSAAQYLDAPSGRPTLAHEATGRPHLTLDGLPLAFHVSLSVSDPLTAVAFSLSPSIGVDVQRIPPADQIDETLLRRTLHPAERPAFDSSPHPLPLRFAACWTRKEALLKALGTGLLIEPNTVPIPPTQFDSPQPLTLPQLSTPLRLTTWILSPTHVLSVCTPDPAMLIR